MFDGGAHDPLEPGQRAYVVHAVSRRGRASADDDTTVSTTSRSSPLRVSENVIGEQQPDLVSGQRSPARVVGHQHAQPIGVGVMHESDVGPSSFGLLTSELQRVLVLGIR